MTGTKRISNEEESKGIQKLKKIMPCMPCMAYHACIILLYESEGMGCKNVGALMELWSSKQPESLSIFSHFLLLISAAELKQ
ncbi:MAG: hypothetical protein AYK18_17515 [Theionarchaea archaeon DG-70]|nr:MAG: hypothetical protein AYK18_17515 [Theionarchaea archaeon DG-70]